MEVISSIYNSGYNIKKFYLGSRELNLAYLGNQVIYDEVIGDNDLNYILYEFYGSDTLPNTVEAPVKSAILKGNTLVNLVNKNTQINATWNTPSETVTIGDSGITISLNDNTQRISVSCELVYLLKPNTKYIIIGNVSAETENHASAYLASYIIQWFKDGVYKGEAKLVNNLRNQVFTTGGDFNRVDVMCYCRGFTGSVIFDYPMIFEYQDGMENWDITYGELVSVKMPVLKTFNKNLLDLTNIKTSAKMIHPNGYVFNYNGFTLFESIPMTPNTLMSFNVDDTNLQRVAFLDASMNFIKVIDLIGIKTTTSPSDTAFMHISLADKNVDSFFVELGVEEISDEPYKSNILTVNEEVELRGVGEVKDELNLLTGELTQRIGEVVLDGSEDETWNNTLSNHYVDQETKAMCLPKSFIELPAVNAGKTNIMVNDFKVLNTGYTNGQGYDVMAISTNDTWHIQFVKQGVKTVEKWREFLQSNPIKIKYPLTTESVKTVDLTIVDQDGKTINKLNSFNGTTHVSTDVAENSAYPMVSLEVASELQAAMSKVTEDIELIKPVQNDIETTIDTQSNDIDSLLLATTELFEMFL